MMIMDPKISSPTTNMPNASERMLLVESGAELMCRKNTRCTPIWAIARTASNTGMLGDHTTLDDEAANETAVKTAATVLGTFRVVVYGP